MLYILKCQIYSYLTQINCFQKLSTYTYSILYSNIYLFNSFVCSIQNISLRNLSNFPLFFCLFTHCNCPFILFLSIHKSLKSGILLLDIISYLQRKFQSIIIQNIHTCEELWSRNEQNATMLTNSVELSDCCLMPNQQFFSYIMERISYIRWNDVHFVLDQHV